jgi:hypothetical protein
MWMECLLSGFHTSRPTSMLLLDAVTKYNPVNHSYKLWVHEMLATIQFRILCISVSCFSVSKMVIKAKALPIHAMKALGGRGIAPTHSPPRHKWGWMIRVTPRPRPEKGPPVQEAGWTPGPGWTRRLEEKSFRLYRDRPRSPGRPARSQTLYWLSYSPHLED